jgi:hypothetical protein
MSIRYTASGANLKRTTSLPLATSYTMMGWFKINQAPGATLTGTFFDYSNVPSTEQKQLGCNSSLQYTFWNGATSFTGSTLSIGRWYHVAYIFDNNQTANSESAYLNGYLDFTFLSNGVTPTTAIYAGNSADGGWLNGSFCGIKIWNEVLQISQIKLEMKYFMPVQLRNLNCATPCLNFNNWWDFSGNRNVWTPTGTLLSDSDPPIPMLQWAPPGSMFEQMFLFMNAPFRRNIFNSFLSENNNFGAYMSPTGWIMSDSSEVD